MSFASAGPDGMLPTAMNTNAFSLTFAALLLLIPACGEPTKIENTNAPVPKPNEVFRKDLLGGPAEEVRKDSRTAKDFPDLKITAVAASKPEGDETLDYWEDGVFHIVIKLSSGKQVRNTYKTGMTESMSLIEGVQITGLVFGCLGMKKGEIRDLFIPAELGFADDGDPATGIGPNATLLVRVELVEFGATTDADYKIKRIKAGTGEVIRNGRWGRFHYTGVLADGEKSGLVFDSSMQTGRDPMRVQVGPAGQVIRGWQLGLQSMKVGERRWLKIPPHFAYGASGQGAIPPDATLIFEVELMSIDPGGGGFGAGFPGGGPARGLGGLLPGQGR